MSGSTWTFGPETPSTPREETTMDLSNTVNAPAVIIKTTTAYPESHASMTNREISDHPSIELRAGTPVTVLIDRDSYWIVETRDEYRFLLPRDHVKLARTKACNMLYDRVRGVHLWPVNDVERARLEGLYLLAGSVAWKELPEDWVPGDPHTKDAVDSMAYSDESPETLLTTAYLHDLAMARQHVRAERGELDAILQTPVERPAYTPAAWAMKIARTER